MRLAVLAVVALVAGSGDGWASGTIYYGSRAGMVVDVVSVSGLGTANAVIRTRHTRANATAFCREYVGKVTADCIREELAAPLNDQINANCISGVFTDFGGHRYRFAGPSKDKDAMAKYRIIDLDTGEAASGDMASGYPTNASLFKALCPAQAPSDIEG